MLQGADFLLRSSPCTTCTDNDITAHIDEVIKRIEHSGIWVALTFQTNKHITNLYGSLYVCPTYQDGIWILCA